MVLCDICVQCPSSGPYFVIKRSSMEAGVRLDLGGGTEMARPAPLRLGVKHKRLERNLDPGREVKAEPGVQWLSGCPGRQEPGGRISSSLRARRGEAAVPVLHNIHRKTFVQDET